MAAKRMFWSDQSMHAAVDSILPENRGLREAARLYNILVETLKGHVNGSVEVGAAPDQGQQLCKQSQIPWS